MTKKKLACQLVAALVGVFCAQFASAQQHYQEWTTYCNAAEGVSCLPESGEIGNYTQLTIKAYCGSASAPSNPSKLTCSSPSTIVDCGEHQNMGSYWQCKCNVDPSYGYKFKAKASIQSN